MLKMRCKNILNSTTREVFFAVFERFSTQSPLYLYTASVIFRLKRSNDPIKFGRRYPLGDNYIDIQSEKGDERE